MQANKYPLEDSTLQVWLNQTVFELDGIVIRMAVPTLLTPNLYIFLQIMHLFVIFT